MRAQPPGFFLYAASRAASTPGFSWGCAEWPVVRVFGNSTPRRSKSSTHAQDDTRCPNAVGFARRHDGWSTSEWNTPPRPPPFLKGRSIIAAAGVAFAADAPAWAEASSQPCLGSGRIASSAPVNLWRTERSGPPLGRSDLASKAPPPWCAAPAIVGQNLRVSSTILWHTSGNISIIYAKLNTTDFVMPQTRGQVMANCLMTADPQLKPLFTSGSRD
jgi:hypothetical protein